MDDGDVAPATLVLFDPKQERGGGQAVLEDLLDLLADDPDVRLVMPRAGREKVRVADSIHRYDDFDALIGDSSVAHRVVLVCNANSGMPSALGSAKRLRAMGHAVSTVAIAHNYPMNTRTRIATPFFFKQFDQVIVVEPGLASLRRDADIPSWLSLGKPLSTVADYADSPIRRTGRVKSYGRPDRMKGLDLLPAIFGPLTDLGFHCEVALGSGFSQDDKYLRRLETDLAPWLADGQRNSSWIDPGDVFVIPSRYGEAACLLAQEVLSRGAFAVAGRVGLIPYLAPDGRGMRTFAVDDTGGAFKAIHEALTMPEDLFAAECLAGVALIEHRAGTWHEQVVAKLRLHTGSAQAS